jgi:16S rRNA (guanine527-N7)-methyltransferase
MKDEELLISGANKLGLELSSYQVKQFLDYMEYLQKWNKKINLTAIDNSREIIIKHFLDSISCVTEMNLQKGDKVIDIGTGPGFPGIPLKIINPGIELSLLDSTNKKVNFLKNLSRKLDLNDIDFIHGRAEDYGQETDYREKFDFVVARAVSSLNILCEYTIPFLKHGGRFIAQKGGEVKNEIIEAERTIEILGAEFYDVVSIDLPYADVERCLVIINKIRKTPSKYPRRAGIPKQSPISN